VILRTRRIDPAAGGGGSAGDHGGRRVTQHPATSADAACAAVVDGDRTAGVQHATTLDDDDAAALDGSPHHTHGDGWPAGDGAGNCAAHVGAATTDPATDHDHATGDGDDGAAHDGRDDHHGRHDHNDPVSGTALVGPSE
jgi:hypothetical protein